MGANPAFAATPNIASIQLSVANPNRDGSGTLVVVATAPTAGFRINRVRVCAPGNTTAGMIRFYISDGTFHRLIPGSELPVPVSAPSATTEAWWSEAVRLAGMVLPVGASLRASTEKGEVFNVLAEIGNI